VRIQAAVVREINQVSVETVELDVPKANEILVRVRAAGVCHSDLHNMRGELRLTPPFVMGHEGAGVVESVGSSVTGVKSGDRVLVNWLPADNTCMTCLSGHPTQCERLARQRFRACSQMAQRASKRPMA